MTIWTNEPELEPIHNGIGSLGIWIWPWREENVEGSIVLKEEADGKFWNCATLGKTTQYVI